MHSVRSRIEGTNTTTNTPFIHHCIDLSHVWLTTDHHHYHHYHRWLSITRTWFSAVSSLEWRSAACARNATGSALSATPMSGPRLWSASAMSATMAHIRAGVSSAVVPGLVTPTIARSVRFRRRTGMAVPRLSTWAPVKRICFMSARSMALKRGDPEVCAADAAGGHIPAPTPHYITYCHNFGHHLPHDMDVCTYCHRLLNSICVWIECLCNRW